MFFISAPFPILWLNCLTMITFQIGRSVLRLIGCRQSKADSTILLFLLKGNIHVHSLILVEIGCAFFRRKISLDDVNVSGVSFFINGSQVVSAFTYPLKECGSCILSSLMAFGQYGDGVQ